jgi:hypothetical protein
MSTAGFISPYYAPLNDRIRKRRAFGERAFADQELMQSTLNCYLGYQQQQPFILPPPPLPPPLSSSYEATNNLLNAKPTNDENTAQTKPKISFSIESIIGIK